MRCRCAASAAAGTGTRPSTALAPGARTTTSSRHLRATTPCCCSRRGAPARRPRPCLGTVLALRRRQRVRPCHAQGQAERRVMGTNTDSCGSGPAVVGAQHGHVAAAKSATLGRVAKCEAKRCAQVAGLLLKKYKERFATAPVAATYRYLRQWAADTLPANPLVRCPTASEPGRCNANALHGPGVLSRLQAAEADAVVGCLQPCRLGSGSRPPAAVRGSSGLQACRCACRGEESARAQVTHETDARHLRDPAFLVRALRYRTGKLLFTVAQRLRKHTGRLGAFHGAACAHRVAWLQDEGARRVLPHAAAASRVGDDRARARSVEQVPDAPAGAGARARRLGHIRALPGRGQ